MLINNQRYAELAGANYNDETIKKGPMVNGKTLVYSRTHTIVDQFKVLANWGPCILITSFSDNCVTRDMVRKLPDNVKAWYSNNVDCINSRVHPLPIGCVYNVEREKTLLAHIEQGTLVRDNLVYMNFTRLITRTPNPREGLYEQFGGQPWVTTKGGVAFDSVSPDQFYTDLRSHHYCLSPHGAGPDCHRHWEAMLLGCIPIVLKDRANLLLEHMPALRVDDWSQVTESLLREQLLPLMRRFKAAEPKLYFEHWKEEICR